MTLDVKVYSTRVMEKMAIFNTYLQTISDNKTKPEDAMKAIDLACNLFVNEQARVQVLSTKTGMKSQYTIRDYLNRLQLNSGQYNEILIEYADISYATEFKKGTDGKYYGVGTFANTYTGFKDGKIRYSDIQKQKAIVILKQFKNFGEGSLPIWEVFLANVGVVETRKL